MLHYRQMDDLVRMLREKLPNVPMLMTTPPGSYESFRQRRRRRTYKINPAYCRCRADYPLLCR